MVRLRDERGAANILIIPAAMALMLATLFAIRTLGSATDDSRQARAAADSAALAAVGAWADAIDAEYQRTASATSLEAFWSFAGRSLGSFTTSQISARASRFAQENGAELVSVQVRPAAGTVTVVVRDKNEVPETGQRLTHQSTAQLRFGSGSGVCRSGSKVGYLLAATCYTSSPLAPTDGEPVDFVAPTGLRAPVIEAELTG